MNTARKRKRPKTATVKACKIVACHLSEQDIPMPPAMLVSGDEAMERAVRALPPCRKGWLNIAVHIGRAIAEFEEVKRLEGPQHDYEFHDNYQKSLHYCFENAWDGFDRLLHESLHTDGHRFDTNLVHGTKGTHDSRQTIESVRRRVAWLSETSQADHQQNHWDRVGRDGLMQALNLLSVGDRLWLNTAIRSAQAYAEIWACDLIAEPETHESSEDVLQRLRNAFEQAWSTVGDRVLQTIQDEHPRPREEERAK